MYDATPCTGSPPLALSDQASLQGGNVLVGGSICERRADAFEFVPGEVAREVHDGRASSRTGLRRSGSAFGAIGSSKRASGQHSERDAGLLWFTGGPPTRYRMLTSSALGSALSDDRRLSARCV